jgi:MFS transporter, PAT family, beta-lactamase induction signal transducer AmpG
MFSNSVGPADVKSGSIFQKIFNLKQMIIFVLGFSSGFPLLLTGSTFKLWLTQEGLDIKLIGIMSLVGIAYSFKFLWAPLLDRYYIPFLGRRKTWLIATQLLLSLGLFMMSQLSPTTQLTELAIWAVIVATFSATQDIVIDAYRREILSVEEIGLGSSMSTYGYRVAMWISGGVLVSFVADNSLDINHKITWSQFYFISAIIFVAITLVTFFFPEPKNISTPKTLFKAVVEPFKDFFQKENAWLILLFIFLFKLGDQISGSLLTPFYKSMGYANSEIGWVTKTCGMLSTFAGLFVGGIALLKLGVRKCLFTFGVLQALSTASFALVTFTGPVIWSLATVVIFEDFSSGMGTAAFIAFMASITNEKYTATQFALLSSLAAVGRTLFSGYAGYLKESLGWAGFFYLGAVLAAPGLIMLYIINRTTPAVPTEA